MLNSIKDDELWSHTKLFLLSMDGFLKDSDCSEISSGPLHERMAIISVQVLVRILLFRQKHGSLISQDSIADTCYLISALEQMATFPHLGSLKNEILDAISKEHKALVLEANKVPSSDNNNISTETYPRRLLKTSSVAVKRNFDVMSDSEGTLLPDLEQLAQKVLRFADFFSSLDHLKQSPYNLVKASVLEALIYRPRLQAMRYDVFPATNAKEKDKYLDYIPIMWVFPSTCQGLLSAPEYLFDMMVLSMYVFLVDEYMESNVAQFTSEEFAALKADLEAMHHGGGAPPNSEPEIPNLSPNSESENHKDRCDIASDTRLQAAITIFRNFSIYIQNWPRVRSASRNDRLNLSVETQTYLLSHLTQLEDNTRLSRQDTPSSSESIPHIRFFSPRTPYQTWVNTIGAGHISGPWAFSFFNCVTSGSIRRGADAFSTVKQKLMAHSMNAHLGAFCRMYNDYGSIARDHQESNLNSVNFPEFFDGKHDDAGAGLGKAKETLLEAAVWEREQAKTEMEALCETLEKEGAEGKAISRNLRVYMGACEQFSDMYLTKDVTNSVK